MKKFITPQPEVKDIERHLKWLEEGKSHVLHPDGLSEIVRVLIKRVNELQFEVDQLRQRP